MTAAKLIELEAKATEGPWYESNSDQAGLVHAVEDDFDTWVMTGRKNNRELIAYLRNHCKDFIRLMEAAEAVKRYPLLRSHIGSQLDDVLEEALAAFKEKS